MSDLSALSRQKSSLTPPASPTSEQFYITGGTLPNSAASYVTRQADADLLDGLLTGEFCYILNARQMGKSSLMVRTAAQLRSRGVTVALLDVTAIGQNVTPVEWYDGLVTLLAEQIKLRDEMEDYWYAHDRLGPMLRFLETVRNVALQAIRARASSGGSGDGQLVIFVDEIDAVRSLPFSTDEFFGGIRECYNRRADDAALSSLTFCLIGVATPSDLISDARMSPFNIGRRIMLRDFTLDEMRPLVRGLSVNQTAPAGTIPPPVPDKQLQTFHSNGPINDRDLKVLDRIYYWAHGHPYLTQRLLKTAASSDASATDADVDRLCQLMFFTKAARETDDNIMFVHNRLLKSGVDPAAVLTLYRRVRAGRKVLFDETNPVTSVLELSDAVRVENGRLLSRNRIYDHVFDIDWTRAHLPDAEVQRQRAAFRRGLLRASTIYAGIILVMFALIGVAMRSARLANLAESKATASAEYNRRLAYVLNINVAQQRYNDASILPVLQSLADTEPASGEDLRGFEWGYLRQICHQDLLTMRFNGASDSAAYAPDGRSLAIALREFGVRVFRVESTKLSDVLDIPLLGVRAVAYAPDGKVIATATGDGVIRMWDARSGRIMCALRGHSGAVTSIAFSPDGKLLISGSADKTARIWDVSTRQTLHILRGHSGRGVYSVAVSFDGAIAATGGDNAVLRIWDMHTGKALRSLAGHSWYVYSVAFSPVDDRLASAGADGKIFLWNPLTGARLQTIRGHTSFIYGLAFSPDGARLASASWDNTARIWNPNTGDEILRLRGHTVPLFALAFSPDNRHLVTCAGWDSEIKLWDTTRTSDVRSLPMRECDTLEFAPDNRRLLTIDGILDADTGRLTLRQPGPDYSVRAFSPDGKYIVTAARSGMLTITSSDNGRLIDEIHSGIKTINTVCYAPSGDRIAAQGVESGLMCWSVVNHRRLWSDETFVCKNGLHSIQFTHDGTRLICSDGDTAQVRDADNGRLIQKFGSDCFHACFSPDGRRAATCGLKSDVQIWDTLTGRRLLVLQGHTGFVYCVAYSSDGRRLITAGGDGTVRVWEARIGKELLTLRCQTREIIAVAMSPNNLRIASASYDGSIAIYSADPLSATP